MRHILFLILILTVGSCKDGNPARQQAFSAAEEENALFATLVSHNGRLVSEQYANGKTRESLCDIQSLTKGLISILLGIAIDKGYVASVDEPIETYFPDEFKRMSDKRKEAITIKHLLNQTSGLEWKGYLEHEAWLRSKNPILYVLEKKLDSKAGSSYTYNSGATHLLSVIISKATKRTSLEFANEFLFTPLDIDTLDWQIRNSGYHDGSGLGLRMRAIDLMKLGHLLENKGMWNGKEIVSQAWIRNLFDEKEKSSTTWGLRQSSHGFCWYKAEMDGIIIDYGMGYGGQFILMIPEKALIIVTTHNHDTPHGIEQQIAFLTTKLPTLIETYGS